MPDFFKTSESSPTPLPVRSDERTVLAWLRPRVLTTLMVLLGMFLVLELLTRLMFVASGSSLSHSRHFDLKYKMATQRLDNVPVMLLLGDSKMNFAVFPELLQARLRDNGKYGQITVKSLAGHSNTPAMNLFLLKAAVAAGTKPSVVLFNLEPWHFVNRKIILPLGYRAEEHLKPTYMGQCLYQSPPREEVFSCQVARWSYLYRQRHALRDYLDDVIAYGFHPEKGRKPKPDKENYIELEASRNGWAPGFSVFDDTPPLQKDAAKKTRNGKPYWATANYQALPLGWHEDELKALQEFCTQHHIKLLLVWLPELQSDSVYPGLDFYRKKYTMLAQSGNSRFLDLSALLLPRYFYHDARHVNVAGGVEVTLKVAEAIAGAMPEASAAETP